MVLHIHDSYDSPCDSPVNEKLQGNRGGCSYNVFSNKTFANSRKALRSGAEKITRTFKNVKKSFGSFSQNLKAGGSRRYRLAEVNSPCRTPATPQNIRRKALGRTPTKLYSPFGIETPRYSVDRRHPPSLPETPEHELSPKGGSGAHPWRFLSKKRPRALFR